MRIFNLISSWLLWMLCACYALTVLAILLFDRTPHEGPSPEKLSAFVKTFWLALGMFTAFAAGAYFIRRRIWFARNRAPGVGFWVVTSFFYFSVLFVTAAGFAPYFSGDHSPIQLTSCVLGLVFVALGFPQVPKVSVPPPVPTGGELNAVTK